MGNNCSFSLNNCNFQFFFLEVKLVKLPVNCFLKLQMDSDEGRGARRDLILDLDAIGRNRVQIISKSLRTARSLHIVATRTRPPEGPSELIGCLYPLVQGSLHRDPKQLTS